MPGAACGPGTSVAGSRAPARFRMERPRYIVVEGPVGVGKSALARVLAERSGGRLVEEVPEENPFLRPYYQDRRKHAFQAQLFFLLSRYRQQQALFQKDLLSRSTVAEYLIARTEVLLARVRRRGRDYERSIDGPWLEALAKAYNDYFFHYDETPLLVVNASDIDLEAGTEDLEALLAVIRKHRKGTQHYVPLGTRTY